MASILLIITANGAIAGDGYQWRNITVGAGGFAPNIIFSESEEDLAYLRTDMGGAYRWDKKLQRWIPLQDQMAESSYFGIESIAADPKDPEVVHMAAGMYKRNPAAMLRSFDRGGHWEVVPVPFRMGGNEDGRGLGERLAIDPENTDSLYFGSRHDGLWHSRDRGASWHKVKNFPHPGLGLPEEHRATNAGISFVVFPGAERPGVLFVGVADQQAAGIYRSDDNGESWRKISGGPELLPVKAAAAGNNLYIAYSDNIGPNGIKSGAVYKLDIRSGRWTDITPPPKGAEGGFMGISANRQNSNIVAVSTINRWRPRDTIYLSQDGGRHWRELASHSTRDVSDTPYLYWGNEDSDFGWWIAGLAINPFDERELVYTTGATVYRTQNADADKLLWRPWVTGVEQTAVITLASLPAGPELLSGFGDISGFVHEDFDRSPQRMLTDPLFANTNSIHYAAQAPNILVRSGTPPHRAPKGPGTTPMPTLAWSKDYGKNWQPLTIPPLNFSGTTKRYDRTGDNAITVSADGGTFMFMAPVPQISRDRGRHWTAVEGLPSQARPVADRVNARVFYALDFVNSEIFVSRDGGATFSPQNTRGLPEDIRTDEPTTREQAWPLLASPDREGTLWLVSRKGLYRSTDGGRNFKIVKSDIAVEQMDFGRAAPGESAPTLFAIGSRDGLRAIWRSDDSGRHWLRINDERHEYGRRFRTIAGDPRHFGRVYVATDGRGIVMGEPAR
ncbi:WD40/YVTN/BNR-like repeat-containing protein [Microbulbifer sp.]|uniref:WD40/YVTN/BNR-like repeat-containing protein n=1 Tax=Microbulbifer sp. TaxID=1908541 RepID=UPI003F3AD860